MEQFNSELSGRLLATGVLFSLIICLLLPWTLDSLVQVELSPAPGEITWLVIGMIPAMTVGLVIGQFNALLVAQERHISCLLDGIPALVILALVLSWPSVSIYPLAIGTAAGVLLHAAILISLLRSSGHIFLPRLARTSSIWNRTDAGFKVMLAGQLVISFVPIIDQTIASLLGAYSNSVLGYSTRILALFLGLGATAIGRALLPVLATIRSYETRKEIVLRWYCILFALGILVVAIGWVITPYCVQLIYQRGAFTNADTDSVSAAVRYGLFQVPLYFSGIVLVQLFTSERNYSILLYASCVALTVKIITGMFLPQLLGVRGIMLTTCCMYFGTSVFLMIGALSSAKPHERSATRDL